LLSGEATNTNFTIFGLTRPGLKHTIYRIRGEHANHYASDAVYVWVLISKVTINIIKRVLVTKIEDGFLKLFI
jgi:3-phenylpropionate/cinnamic acid dioxygenase small subunit